MIEDPPSRPLGSSGKDILVDVILQNKAWAESWPGALKKTSKTIKRVFQDPSFNKPFEGVSVEVSVCLADDAFVQGLNSEFRGKNKPTNVLSFPAGQDLHQGLPAIHLGDIVLAFGVVQREAESQGKPFSDHAAHLLIHGLLHLLGYDHDTEKTAQKMEALEIKLLKSIGIANPYE